MKEEKILFKLNFNKIKDCLIFDEICYILADHSPSESKTLPLVLKISLEKFIILKTFFLLNDVVNIIIRKNSENG